MKCKYDHKDYIGGYKQAIDKRYVNIGNDLHRTRCDDCMKFFACKEQDDMIIPSIKDPICVCLGQHKYEYKHSLCSKCHMTRLDNIGGQPRHRRIK